jgi:hypothetical protein
VNKESRIMITRLEASIKENRRETLKPSAGSLLKTIEGTTQPADHSSRNGVAWRRLHIDFLTKLTIKKGVLDIQLRDRPLTDRGNSEKGPNSGHMSNWSKCLLIVNAILLLKATSHKASLVALKRAIGASFDLVYPLASDRSDMKWFRNKIPSASALKSSNLLSHSVLPLRVSNSLPVGRGLG